MHNLPHSNGPTDPRVFVTWVKEIGGSAHTKVSQEKAGFGYWTKDNLNGIPIAMLAFVPRMGDVVWLSVTSFGRRGDKIKANPLWEGTVRVSARRTGKRRSITAEKRSLATNANGSETGTVGPGDPRLPWWLPDPADGGVVLELQEAVAQSILPAYQQLVLEAPSMMERVAGEMLIQALWADCLRQLKLKHNFAKAISDDPFQSAGVVGEATALLGTKIKAGNFLVKVQEIRLKQQAAASSAIEARRRAMEEYRTQFAGHAAARAGSAHRGQAPGVQGTAGTEVVGAEMEADTAAVAEESRGVDQARPAKAGTPTSRAVAEELRGVDQRGPAKAGTPTSAAVAEELRGVDQRGPAKAGTPTSRAVAEESRGVN